MNYLKQVRKGIDYIESHLDTGITPNDVARHAGISQWHFQRIFKALTNETLVSYIRARRLANSMSQLLTTDLRILDIALSAGYENQESYTRAFRHSFRMTPTEYRKIGKRSMFLQKTEIDEAYINHIQNNLTLEPLIEQQQARRLIGLRTEFYSEDSEKNNIAKKLPLLWSNFLARLNEIPDTIDGTCYGVIHYIDSKSEQLNYVAGIEVTKTAKIPIDMEEIIVPACTCARFTHRGFVANLDNTVNYIYANWLFKSGYRHTYGPDVEIYGADYHPTSSESVINYAIPVTRVQDN